MRKLPKSVLTGELNHNALIHYRYQSSTRLSIQLSLPIPTLIDEHFTPIIKRSVQFEISNKSETYFSINLFLAFLESI